MSKQQITVTIEYFAILRERSGLSTEQCTTTAATASELYGELEQRHQFPPFDSLKVAINDEFSDWGSQLSNGDLVVFIPPVAGG